MVLKFFPEATFLLKVDRFEGILNWIKLDGMVNDHSSSSHKNFKNFTQILLKKHL